jgi:DMSO/TMAO reductase YedYZ molybdopterin-dependent catalytic subunit
MSDTRTLIIDGLVQNRLALEVADFGRYPTEARIADVSQLIPKREGRAVKLGALLAAACPRPEAKYMTLHSSDGTFSASIERAEVEPWDLGLCCSGARRQGSRRGRQDRRE